DSPPTTRDLHLARGPHATAAGKHHDAERGDDFARGLLELDRLLDELPALPRVERRESREAEEHPELGSQLRADELRGASHRRVDEAASLRFRDCDDASDAADRDITDARAHSVFENADVAHSAPILLRDEVPDLRSPAVVRVLDAEDVLAPAEERRALLVAQVVREPNLYAQLFFTLPSKIAVCRSEERRAGKMSVYTS